MRTGKHGDGDGAEHGSVTSSHTAETKINSTVPVANGTGASTETAASVSTPARATRSPSGSAGVPRHRLAHEAIDDALTSEPATCHCVLPAHVRRTTTPAARKNPIPMIADADQHGPTATWPSSKRGTMTWSVTHCTAMADPTVHSEQRGAGDGDGERARGAGAARRAASPGSRGRIAPRSSCHGVPRPRRPCGRSFASAHSLACPSRFTRPVLRALRRYPPRDGADRSGAAGRAADVRRRTLTARLQQDLRRRRPPVRAAGSGRWACAGRQCRRASPRRPRSRPACCSPSGFSRRLRGRDDRRDGGRRVGRPPAQRLLHLPQGRRLEYVAPIAVVAWAVATIGPGEVSLDHALDLTWDAWDG